jgi:hypothetical protein
MHDILELFPPPFGFYPLIFAAFKLSILASKLKVGTGEGVKRLGI